MFKAGDKVYSYRFGIAVLKKAVVGIGPLSYPLQMVGAREYMVNYLLTECGREDGDDPYPSIITLEKAEKLGFIRKTQKPLRVKYSVCSESREMLFITDKIFSSQEEFAETSGGEFLCFVDDYLNPVNPITEWEEV